MAPTPIQVLLVEDNPGDVLLIRRMLRDSAATAFELTGVDRLAAAQQLLQEQPFGVILLDLSLPDSHGLETFRLLRQTESQLPVVVLTGLDDEVLALQAVGEGAQDYLVKGQITDQQLAHSLRYAMSRQHRQRGLEATLQATELELALARQIHQDLLPREVPLVVGCDLFGASLSAGAVGGDLFQYLPFANGTLGLAVADVTGHGVGPALLMAAVRSYLRAFARTTTDVGQIVTLTNSLFAEDVTEGNNCTLFLGCLDVASRTLNFASAGHHPPGLILGKSGAPKAQLYSTGLPLGILPDARYSVESIGLEPGEMLVLLTDGVVEARSAAREYFRQERVLEVIRKQRTLSARQIVEAIFQAVQDFTQGLAQGDDITAVVIKMEDGPRSG